MKYTIGGPNPPPGLSITRVVTRGEEDDEETLLYFSKPLKSAGENGTGEARSMIVVEQNGIDEGFKTVSVDGVIYTVGKTGNTLTFTRDSVATETVKKYEAEKLKFIKEVQSTVITVDGLTGVSTLRGLTVDTDGSVSMPLKWEEMDGTKMTRISLADSEGNFKKDGNLVDTIIGGIVYGVSIKWTNGKPSLTFKKDDAKTTEYKKNQEKNLIEKNTAFVTKHNDALSGCAKGDTGDICTDTQKSFVVAAIVADAPLVAVKALQKEMKLTQTGIWDATLLNALMHQGKKK